MLTFKPWKIESLLQMLLGVFSGIALVGFLAAGLGYKPQPGEIDRVMMIVSALSFHGVGLLWLNWFLQDHEVTWWEALGLRSPRIGLVLLLALITGVGGFYVCNQLGALVLQIMSRFAVPVESQTTVQALQTAVSPVWVIAFGVISIGLAPVVEEFIFRGMLFPVLKQLGFPVAAWLTSTLLFAVIHANVPAMLPLAMLALMLTWLYEKTDNLLAPILAHATFNAINFGLTLRYGAFSSASASS